jgi:hypothetical protein
MIDKTAGNPQSSLPIAGLSKRAQKQLMPQAWRLPFSPAIEPRGEAIKRLQHRKAAI